MEPRIVLIGLLAVWALSIEPAAAQPIVDPSSKPEPLATPADSPSPEGFRQLLMAGATIRYQLINRDVGSKSMVTLRHVRGDEYLRSDGVRTRNLTDLINDAEFQYSPPIPLARAALVPGQKWSYIGTVSERSGIASARIDCAFRVAGKATIVTPEGTFDAVEIVETRQIGGIKYVAHRFVDEKRGIVVKEVWTTIRGGGHTKPGREIRAGRIDTDMTLESISLQ